MLEEYLNVITNMENYYDGIIVLDDKANIVYMRQFRPDYTPLDEQRAIGKNIFDVYSDLDPETSTIMKALKYGETTMNNIDVLTTVDGKTIGITDNTFPIKEDNKIIGAVNVATFSEGKAAEKSLELYTTRRKPRKDLYQIEDIIGRSPAIANLRNQVQRISKTSSSVLVYGNTGSGKELVAQSIHSASDRRDKPFISQNCAAIPATLLESLFFGTTKGSFTGAEDKKGLFEEANGGTVFLDEINSMDVNLQAKLLRVLEDKKITKIGNSKPIDVDVRIIAATNKAPAQCIKDGTLRPDLFYRLGSVTIEIPDLKDRGDDIELLTEYFISVYNSAMHKNIIGVSQDVVAIFKSYSWPGNVREFRNVIEGAFNLCEGSIIVKADLPSYILFELDLDEIIPQDDTFEKKIQWLGSLKKNMDAYEKTLITDAINKHDSLTAAADYLGITRQSLNQKLKKFEINH